MKVFLVSSFFKNPDTVFHLYFSDEAIKDLSWGRKLANYKNDFTESTFISKQ